MQVTYIRPKTRSGDYDHHLGGYHDRHTAAVRPYWRSRTFRIAFWPALFAYAGLIYGFGMLVGVLFA